MELFNPDAKYILKDHKTLELYATNKEELEAWQASFLRAGVYPERGDEAEGQAAAVRSARRRARRRGACDR